MHVHKLVNNLQSCKYQVKIKTLSCIERSNKGKVFSFSILNQITHMIFSTVLSVTIKENVTVFCISTGHLNKYLKEQLEFLSNKS
jgi:hypothetical protein